MTSTGYVAYLDTVTDIEGGKKNHCPACKADLTQTRSVTLYTSVDERVMEHVTRLETTGEVVDVDRLIHNGYESGVDCGACSENLSDYLWNVDPGEELPAPA